MRRRGPPRVVGGSPNQAFDPILLDVPERNLIVAVVQRAASTSMLAAVGNMRERAIETVDAVRKRDTEGTKIVMWVRDPFERLASSLSLIHRRQRARPVGLHYRDVPLKFILGRDNVHWKPQLELHKHNGLVIPNEVYAFEELETKWPELLPEFVLERKNVTTGPIKRSWAEYEETLTRQEMAQLRNFYREDINARKKRGF